jgi:hypothetical protein
MRFTKIRYADKTVTLAWEEKTDRRAITTEESCAEEPAPEFDKALKSMGGFLRELTGIKDKVWLEKAEVVSVRVNYSKEDRRGIIISVKRPVEASNSPVTLSTPLVWEPDDADLPVFQALDELVEQAAAYQKGARAQQELSLDPPAQQDLEDAIEAEQEATRRIRQQQDFEIRSALAGALPDLPAGWSPDGEFRPDDDDLTEFISDSWADQEYEFEGTPIAGLFRHETADHQVVWCYLMPDPKLTFFYGIAAPDQFNPVDAIPTYQGAELLELARSLYYPDDARPEPEQAPPAAADAPPTPEPDVQPARDFAALTRPQADPGELTTVLMQGLHTLLFEAGPLAIETLRTMHELSATDGVIEDTIRGAFLQRGKGLPRFGLSEPLGMNGNEPIDFATIDCTLEPLSISTGKGKKKQKLEGQLLVDAVRSMLQIPEPPADAEEPVLAGAAADDVDDLFGDRP